VDVYDDEIIKQDEEYKDHEEIELLPAKRKSKKTVSKQCKKQGVEKKQLDDAMS